MPGFKQHALTLLVVVLPTASYALQPMDEAQLSGVTGQDGVTLSVDLPDNLGFDATLYDRDGIGASASPNGVDTSLTPNSAGAISFQNVVLHTSGAIPVVIDAGQDGGKPVLNVNITLPGGTTIKTGDLFVATTGATGWATSNASDVIMPSSTISLGSTPLTVNMQLGNVAQSMTDGGAGTWKPMIGLQGVATGGVTMTPFALWDRSDNKIGGDNTDAALTADSVWLVDNNANAPGTALTFGDATQPGVGLNVTSDGLALGIGKLGSASGLNVYMKNVGFGNAAPTGDLALTGLKLGGASMTLAGHGQGGLTQTLVLPDITFNQAIFDRDGIGATAQHGMTANAGGAALYEGTALHTGAGGIVVNANAGASGSKAVLNLGVDVPDGTTFDTGDLYIVDPQGAWGWNDSTKVKVLSSTRLEFGAGSRMNIQLGNAVRPINSSAITPAVGLDVVLTGGVTMNNFALADNSSSKIGGVNTVASLSADKMWIVDNNGGVPGANLSALSGSGTTGSGLGLDVTKDGLTLYFNHLGGSTASSTINNYMKGIRYGNSVSAGDLAMTNINLNGSILRFSGHDGGGIKASLEMPSTGFSMTQTIYDRDGIDPCIVNATICTTSNPSLTSLNLDNPGAIRLKNMVLRPAGNTLDFNMDVGQSAKGQVLNLDVSLPGGELDLGTLTIASINDGTTGTNADWALSNESGTILESATLIMDKTSLNIQLGNVAQSMSYDDGKGHSGTWNPAIVLRTTLTDGIKLQNYAIHDATANGASPIANNKVAIGEVLLIDSKDDGSDGTNLTVGGGTGNGNGLGISVTTNGLVIGLDKMGDLANTTTDPGVNMHVTGVTIGGSQMGNLHLLGLHLASGSTLTIAGH